MTHLDEQLKILRHETKQFKNNKKENRFYIFYKEQKQIHKILYPSIEFKILKDNGEKYKRKTLKSKFIEVLHLKYPVLEINTFSNENINQIIDIYYNEDEKEKFATIETKSTDVKTGEFIQIGLPFKKTKKSVAYEIFKRNKT